MPLSCAARTMPVRFSRVCVTVSPRSASLAPSATTRIRVRGFRNCSSRRNPPALVSPEMPALTTSTCVPLVRELVLDERRERLLAQQAEAGRQAVAEEDDGDRLRSRRRRVPGLRAARRRRRIGVVRSSPAAAPARRSRRCGPSRRPPSGPAGGSRLVCAPYERSLRSEVRADVEVQGLTPEVQGLRSGPGLR